MDKVGEFAFMAGVIIGMLGAAACIYFALTDLSLGTVKLAMAFLLYAIFPPIAGWLIRGLLTKNWGLSPTTSVRN